ncbi:hypothetical protein PO124_27055 [Bacillus licheniformis]|nr:hypothetical protein [Bacillus licheniformis]
MGEIEAVLANHPVVKQAAAIVREDQPGDPRLFAYAVPASGESLDPAELRRFVGETLPDYMIPSALSYLMNCRLRRTESLTANPCRLRR